MTRLDFAIVKSQIPLRYPASEPAFSSWSVTC